MKIIDTNKNHLTVLTDEGKIETLSNSKYYKLKFDQAYMDKRDDTGRILHKFADNQMIHETYNPKIFNCMYKSMLVQSRQSEAETICGFILDNNVIKYAQYIGERYQVLNCKDILEKISQKKLAEIIKIYGEEKKYTRISKSIIEQRNKNGINTTFDLKNAICNVISKNNEKKCLSRVFQAIRIVVNDEINNLKNTLMQTVDYLETGGRIVVISFHSLEDRIIKHFFKDSIIYKNSTYDVEYKNEKKTLRQINKKPLIPSQIEINNNSKSRSAKLRIAEKI